jgi:hypothetical protein
MQIETPVAEFAAERSGHTRHLQRRQAHETDALAAETIDAYDLWTKGWHAELLSSPSDGFLRWAANYGLFPHDQWTARFLAMGALKRRMWQCVGRRGL